MDRCLQYVFVTPSHPNPVTSHFDHRSYLKHPLRRDLESLWPCTSIVTTAVPEPEGIQGLHGLSKASGPVPGRCHLTYLIKKDGWINEVGPGWPCILSCENRFSESWQVIPILVKIRRLWIWSESRAQLLNHIHLIWISDIWSPLSLCFLCNYTP